ncbi:hypothetical protein BGZ61DRAFT_541145 [Ilyonectria robusta]|uniref:uncharacterized protein n=1 Tax=Ilyonectria robusta TaxID=1079257 RepID=UPI001E8D05F2|nr:uncharacterized protein BGZ61DRAFT_541145 [Ilyonectria robusta]KAH8655965.1 hypothetical protein BGZ61DRAFT_541145 [Ilyonectria robusta]
MSEPPQSTPSSPIGELEAQFNRECLPYGYFPRDTSARAYVQFHVAEARRDPWIKPTDAKWRSVHDKFVRLLNSKNKTIRDILMKNFTYHEAALFMPSDRPEIKELQDRHTARYNLLRQGRFKDIVPSLSVKLTMLYFGVSVEPMQSPLDEAAMAIDEREPDGPQIAVAPPLHFLTAHKHRNWGDDAKRMREDPIQPIPAPDEPRPVLTLRGGEADPEPEPPVETVDYMPEGEEALNSSDNWVYLYGLLGCIPFAPTKWRSFSTAVRQLLSLRFSDDRPRYFIFTQFDKETSQMLNHVKEPLPLTKDSAVMKFIQKHCAAPTHTRDCCAFFVKEATDERRDLSWEPQPEQFQADLVKIGYPVFPKEQELKLHGIFPYTEEADPEAKMVRYAYLAFPKTKGEEDFAINNFNANQFNQHFQTAVEVLVGRPEGSFLRGIYWLRDDKNGPFVSDPEPQDMIYGAMGLKFSVWERLHPLKNPRGRWTLRVTPLEEDEIALVAPNAHPKSCHILTREPLGKSPFPKAVSTIKSLASDYKDDGNTAAKQIRLLPGATALGEVIDRDQEGLIYPCAPGAGEAAEVGKFLQKLIDDKAEPFVLVHPIWEPGELQFVPSWVEKPTPGQLVNIPDLGSSLWDFIDSIHLLARVGGQPDVYGPDVDCVVLKSRNCKDKRSDVEFPSFVITPKSKDDDWYRIRAQIRVREVLVTIKGKIDTDWKSSIAKSNIWGPRIFTGIRHWDPMEEWELERGFFRAQREEPGKLSEVIPQTRGPGHGYRFDGGGTGSTHPELEEPVEIEGGFKPDRPRSPHPVDSEERLETWSEQPSIHDRPDAHAWLGLGGYPPLPKIPINAPPVEAILRTTSSVPMVSKAVLTVTEQQKLQKNFWALRNFILGRSVKCQYKNCEFSYRVDRPADIEDHLMKEHRADKCMWCDEPLWEFWDHEQKLHHLQTEHRAIMAEAAKAPATKTAAAPTAATRPGRPGVGSQAEGSVQARLSGLASRWVAAKQAQKQPAGQPGRPKGPPRQLVYPFVNWYDFPGPVVCRDPPEMCRVEHCPRPDVRQLDGEGMYQHFQDYHKDDVETLCPFCMLRFFERKVDEDGVGTLAIRPREDIIKHFECHIYRLWDKIRGPRQSQPSETQSSTSVDPAASTSTNQDVTLVRTCPFFEDCGAVVTLMTKEQLKEHLRANHMEHVHPPRPSRFGLPGSLDRAQDNPEEQTEDGTPVRSVRAAANRGTKRPRESRRIAERKDSQDIPTTDASRGRTPARKPASKLGTVKASIEQEESDGERRRAPSPDWDAKLGPADPDFEPEEGLYCSRCLRKAPKKRDRSPGNPDMSTAEEVEYHMAGDRSCRIRRGLGDVETIPNRSGWVSINRGQGDIKKKFLKKYPAYAKTIYPTAGDNNASLWRSDPNNEDNKDAWNLPWPPFRGRPPFPEDEESPVHDEAEGEVRSRKRHKGSKKPHDPAYKYATDEDDDLESDGDDSSEVQDPNSKPGESSGAHKKKRRGSRGPLDPLYKYRRDVDVDDDLKPDFDDTDEIREMSASLEESGNKEMGKGKRKLAEAAATATATATPSASGQGEQTPEAPQVGPPPKKAKASEIVKAAEKKTRGKQLKAKPSAPPSRASSRQRARRESSVASSSKK